MKNPILIAALAFAATAATLTASPANAEEPFGGRAVAVSYADLDLRTEAGVRTLDRRILSAVQQACGPTSAFDSEGGNLVRACRTETLARLSSQRQNAIASANGAAQVELAAQR